MLPIPSVVEVNGLDSGVRVKGLFVKQDGTTNVVSSEEVIREALVLKILNRFLKSNHVPLPPQSVLRWLLQCLVEVHVFSSRC